MLKLAVSDSKFARTARYEAVNRILSLSFEREPAEHADVMLSANQYLTIQERPRYTWMVLGGAVTAGLVIGLLMELYRRQVLPIMFSEAAIPPLSVILFQFLPFVVLIGGLMMARSSYLERSRRKALAAQIETGQFIDTDVYENGIETTAGDVTVWMPWSTVREIVIANRRIQVIGDAFVAYLPERAFPDREIFQKNYVRLTELKRRSRPASQLEEKPENKAKAA